MQWQANYKLIATCSGIGEQLASNLAKRGAQGKGSLQICSKSAFYATVPVTTFLSSTACTDVLLYARSDPRLPQSQQGART